MSTKHYYHIIKPKNCRNQIPIFMLPDATGSSQGLADKVCKLLDRPVVLFTDARLVKPKLDIQVSLEQLAREYADDIKYIINVLSDDAALKKILPYGMSMPTLIAGHSGGGMLGNKIVNNLTRNAPTSLVRTVHIDSFSPNVLRKLTSKDMADHFINVMTRLSQKYQNVIVINEKKLRKALDFSSIPEQIEYLSKFLDQTYRINQPDEEDDTNSNKPTPRDAIKNFERDVLVMLANHYACYNYNDEDSNFAEIEEDRHTQLFLPAVFVAATKTIEQCTQVSAVNPHLLGWEPMHFLDTLDLKSDKVKQILNFCELDEDGFNKLRKVQSYIIPDSDHYSILQDPKQVTLLAKIINKAFYETDEKLIEATSQYQMLLSTNHYITYKNKIEQTIKKLEQSNSTVSFAIEQTSEEADYPSYSDSFFGLSSSSDDSASYYDPNSNCSSQNFDDEDSDDENLDYDEQASDEKAFSPREDENFDNENEHSANRKTPSPRANSKSYIDMYKIAGLYKRPSSSVKQDYSHTSTSQNSPSGVTIKIPH